VAGAIAEADILGIFAREGLFEAGLWPQTADLKSSASFIAGGMKCHLNYDGAGSKVGDRIASATNSDTVKSSVYAMTSSVDATKMWVMAINKVPSGMPAHITITGGAAYNVYKVYALTSASTSPQYVGSYSMSGGTIDYLMPAYSVTTMELSTAGGGTTPPAIPAPDTTAPAKPTNLRVR
jgi:hypothetical protein